MRTGKERRSQAGFLFQTADGPAAPVSKSFLKSNGDRVHLIKVKRHGGQNAHEVLGQGGWWWVFNPGHPREPGASPKDR